MALPFDPAALGGLGGGAPPGAPPLGDPGGGLGPDPLIEDEAAVPTVAMDQKMDEMLGMMQAILTLLEGPASPSPDFGAPPPSPGGAPIQGAPF